MAVMTSADRWRNSPIVRPLLAGSAWSLVVQIASKGSVLVATLLITRILDVEDFGFFLSMQAIMLLSIAAWDLGLSPMLTRDLAAGKWNLSEALTTSISFRIRLLPIWAAVFAIGSVAIGINGLDHLAACVLIAIASLVNGSSTVLDAALRGELRFRASAIALTCGRLAYAIGVALAVTINPPHALPIMAALFLAGEITVLVVQLPIFRAAGGYSIGFQPLKMAGTVRRSLPYALSGFFALVYNRADILLVTLLAGATQAGLYAPSSRLQDAMMLLPAVAVAGIIPVAARAYQANGSESLLHPLVFSITASLGITLPATLIMFFALPWVLPHVLGSNYEAALAPTRILIWALPIASIEAPILAILTAKGQAHLCTIVYGAALASSVLGLILLAPAYGAVGAAWASFLREPVALLFAIGILVATRREFSSGPIPIGSTS